MVSGWEVGVSEQFEKYRGWTNFAPPLDAQGLNSLQLQGSSPVAVTRSCSLNPVGGSAPRPHYRLPLYRHALRARRVFAFHYLTDSTFATAHSACVSTLPVVNAI